MDRQIEFLWLLQRFALRAMRTRCKNINDIDTDRAVLNGDFYFLAEYEYSIFPTDRFVFKYWQVFEN